MEKVEIVESRLKILLCFCGSLVFVAAAVLLPSDGSRGLLWAGAFFGVCAIVFLVEFIRPRTLTLDPIGFRVSGGFMAKPIDVAWRDVTGFFPLRIRLGVSMVGFVYSDDASKRSAATVLSRRMSGADRSVGGGLWPLSAVALSDELNAYRESALKAEP